MSVSRKANKRTAKPISVDLTRTHIKREYLIQLTLEKERKIIIRTFPRKTALYTVNSQDGLTEAK